MKKKNNPRKTHIFSKSKKGITIPVADEIMAMPTDYSDFIKDLKIRIRKERTKQIRILP